jgi:hypothetical protein
MIMSIGMKFLSMHPVRTSSVCELLAGASSLSHLVILCCLRNRLDIIMFKAYLFLCLILENARNLWPKLLLMAESFHLQELAGSFKLVTASCRPASTGFISDLGKLSMLSLAALLEVARALLL